MGEQLLFRQGTLTQLMSNEANNKVAGSINFTTDEPAIYLDVASADGEVVRRRVGDFMQYADKAALLTYLGELKAAGIEPSVYGLYYTVEENALFVYTGDIDEPWKQINAVQSEGDGSTGGDITGLTDRVEVVESTVNSLTTTTNNLSTNDKAQDERLEALETTIGSSTSTGGTTLVEQVAAHETSISNLQTSISGFNDALDTKASKSDLNALSADLETLETTLGAEIASQIVAANAMRYKGTVGVDSDNLANLPTENVSVGDTYVAIATFVLNETTVTSGDLLVARGDEDENGIITANLAWDIVSTGYQSTHEPKLEVNPDTSAIALKSFDNKDLGSVIIESAEDSNVVVTPNGDTGKFTISLAWSSF